jgi:hypothetical protein
VLEKQVKRTKNDDNMDMDGVLWFKIGRVGSRYSTDVQRRLSDTNLAFHMGTREVS